MKTWADYIGKEVGVFWRGGTSENWGVSGTVLGADLGGLFLACHNDEKGTRGDLFLPWLSIKYISLTSRDELAERMFARSDVETRP